MRVLGIGGSIHDYSVCLVEDGQITFSIEEERVTRVKHAFGLGPRLHRNLASDYVLSAAGIQDGDVDLIIGNDFLNEVYYLKYKDREPHLINHHLAHAASTYYSSNFEEAAILVMDGGGSSFLLNDILYGETISFYRGHGKEITEIKKIKGKITKNPKKDLDSAFEDSLGFLYSITSECIGFISSKGFAEPGKTMGLAPYGTPTYIDRFGEFFSFTEEGDFRQTRQQQDQMAEFIMNTLASSQSEQEQQQRKADFAYAAQYYTEKIIIALCNFLYQKTKCNRLCLAGGVALNSVANYKILQHTPFKEVFVIPATGDNGTAIGAAMYGYYHILNQSRNVSSELFNPYLGVAYDTNTVLNSLKKYEDKIKWKEVENVYRDAARLLADGNIIGWFQGRSEIGPRALGNRSILADPRDKGMKDKINSKVKHREAFRPFAPIILEEKQSEYFSTTHPSYYMLFVPEVLQSKRDEIPAVTHVDGTGRLQTVTRQLNMELYSVVEEFYRQTGTPVLLNTSFNDNGEPIVETPEDAICCFLNTGLDMLFIHNFLISRKEEL
ncbi:carbamoyltransferase family protein [Paenibacillus xylanexedens]|uniref:carbamoyltransferase family protein n=1 Tax=Paenibacillus xylanexedens TaxID=528191 RepID=UPI003CFD9C2C